MWPAVLAIVAAGARRLFLDDDGYFWFVCPYMRPTDASKADDNDDEA
jgi:hypothetical protein